jgi:hypothetical protein
MAQGGDPPARVARLNYISGQVSFRPGSVEDWAAATPNYPLTTGDHLWTDVNARTELHIGSTAVRMDAQTALGIVNLDDRVAQLSLTGGSLNVHLRTLRPDDAFEVDTPNASVLLRPGDYRINVDGDRGVTWVTAHEGEADVLAGGANVQVRARESAQLSGQQPVAQQVGPAPPADNFDIWSMERERRETSVVSARYVPREMIGYEDLDANGTWRNIPPYGMVWVPTSVAPGWAPYHYGHWAWVEPWGWTWIDDAPWGFAPFHYGRWAFAGGMWVWVPGRMMVGVQPMYAPALVAFVGGPRFGVSVAIGGGGGMAAWFPLGPGEVYRPAYQVSPMYVQNINVVHVTNVTVINQVNNVHYANQSVAGAVMVVPHDAFVGARPVHEVEVRMDARELASAPVTTTAGFAPRRESVLAGPARAIAPPARFVERPVVSKSAPPPPPVSFAAKQQALEANGGRPLDTNTMNNLRSNAPVRATPGPAPAVRATPAPARNDRPPGAVTRTEETPRPTPAANTPPRTETPAAKTEERPAPKTEEKPAPKAAEKPAPKPANKKATKK